MPADTIPPAPIDAPFANYAWVDWYQKVRTAINNATIVNWTAITGTPTTVGGYGISDALFVESSEIKIPQAVGNGAGVDVGTLNNAPAAGNPTKWLQINDNGTIRFIPAW